eukprot:6173632-Pleurochrysis_carterae.AAC.5
MARRALIAQSRASSLGCKRMRKSVCSTTCGRSCPKPTTSSPSQAKMKRSGESERGFIHLFVQSRIETHYSA